MLLSLKVKPFIGRNTSILLASSLSPSVETDGDAFTWSRNNLYSNPGLTRVFLFYPSVFLVFCRFWNIDNFSFKEKKDE